MNTYTITVDNYNAHIDGPETVVVQGTGATHDRDALIIWADPEFKLAAAVFRRWEHVTVECPEPTSVRDCASSDCLKHNGYKSPTGEADPGDWKALAAEVMALPTTGDATYLSAVLAIRQLVNVVVAEASRKAPELP